MILIYWLAFRQLKFKQSMLDENKATSMFFLQSPQYLPMIKRSTKADGPEGDLEAHAICKVLCFVWLPPGRMGKMLVCRSRAIKLKLGDSLFDVSSGMKCGFAQDVVVTNENEKGFGIISELNKITGTDNPTGGDIFVGALRRQ
ncbi:hypothetical protein DVH24_029507 [Malus domestica]|uniref:Uncharacterized protein n=1 Tax=Malus domestica TaxID=3750 RepID=A0A498HTL9_MALDO|nr:hypothetical protein DVH24_029507 [Malus domestica]